MVDSHMREKRTAEMVPQEIMAALFTGWFAMAQGRGVDEIKMEKLEAEILHRLEASWPGMKERAYDLDLV